MKGKKRNALSIATPLGAEQYRNAAAQAILNYMLSPDRSSATLQKHIAEMLGYRVLAGDYEPVDSNGVKEFPSLPDDATVDTLVATAMEVGKARRKTLDALRSALQRGDQDASLVAARELVNLSLKGGKGDKH